MTLMIRYSEVENLPADHPKMVAFMKQCQDEDAAYAAAGDIGKQSDDESSLDYFDRYIAGDRK